MIIFGVYTGFVGVIYLDSSQHACGGHTEVQIGQHLSCRRFVDVWRPLSWKIICNASEVNLCYVFIGQNKSNTSC